MVRSVRYRPLSGPPAHRPARGYIHDAHDEQVIYLVMGHCDRDLRHWQTVDSNAFGPHNLRDVFSQIVDGATYMHTGLGLLHCDLKPHSVLAKQLSDGLYAVKVADLGSAVEANPCVRFPMDQAEIEGVGVRCQALFYRAPFSFRRRCLRARCRCMVVGLRGSRALGPCVSGLSSQGNTTRRRVASYVLSGSSARLRALS